MWSLGGKTGPGEAKTNNSKAEADPYGMTKQKTSNTAATAKAIACRPVRNVHSSL
jgi:hypothetical protein